MAGTFAGAVSDQAMLRDHQRQTSVGDQFRGKGLAHVTDLGQSSLKADCGGGKTHTMQSMHRAGIVHIQTEIAVNTHTGFPCRADQTQIAHQHIPNHEGTQIAQALHQSGHFIVVNDSGQHSRHTATVHQPHAKLLVLQQDMHGNVQHGSFQPQQLLSQLLTGGDLNGQAGQTLAAGNLGQFLGLADGGSFPTGPQSGELIQRITAQRIDGGSGEGQTRLYMGLHFHAAVGCAAGLAQALCQRFAGEGDISRNFGHRAVDLTGSSVGITDDDTAAFGSDHRLKCNIHQLAFAVFIGLTGGGEPNLILRLLLTGAEHIPVNLAGIVTVGETLTVESGEKSIHHGLGHVAFVQRLAIDSGDGCHIFRPLHAAFQLDGGNTHVLQILQIMDKAVILQAQGVLILPMGVAVALAAGLGAAATVAGAAADEGGHIALTGVAHAQSAMGEYFDLDGGMFADVIDFLTAQFPTQNHSRHAHGGAKLHT